jgi:hypothetical protein
MCFAEQISKVTNSTIERQLLSSEGINNKKLLHLAENISRVTRSTMELGLLIIVTICLYTYPL